MFESISRGWKLTKASFAELRRDKQMTVLPVLSLITLGVITILLALPTAYFAAAGSGATAIVFLALLYFALYFVVIFFQSAVVEMATIRFNGQTPTIKEGLRGAWTRKLRIVQWAIVAATVGLILRILQNAAQNQRNALNQIVGQIAVSIAGAAWNVATYFVVPVIVQKDLGPFDAIKASLTTWRRAFGESATASFTTGIIFFLLAIPGVLFLFLGFGAVSTAGFVLGITIGLLWLVAVWVVSSTVDAILVTALYQYAATGKMPGAFEEHAPLTPQTPVTFA
jgi:hypothetical protein